MKSISRSNVVVSADGRGVVSRVGARLLSDLADATGLRDRFGEALGVLRPRGTGHDPGRVVSDVAVMIADGGEAISDLAVLRDQCELFGSVASPVTAWRLLGDVDAAGLARLRAARAQAREVAWAQALETRGGLPQPMVAGRSIGGLVLDVDATVVASHSDKENAKPTWKKTFGFHPLLCFLDNTGEALSGMLRAGNAGSNTAADHVRVLDEALTQIPDEHRHGTPVLVRADSAGCTKAFLAHIRSLRAQGIDTRFSVGAAIDEPVRQAILALRESDWIPAITQDGSFKDGAAIAEITGAVNKDLFPAGTRLIVRRERPHPGAQLTLFDAHLGMRHQVMATDTPVGAGSLQFIEARGRHHARVEDKIRCGKDTGIGRFPSGSFAINQVWLELALTSIDLLAWTQMLLLDGEQARCEPKRLRYRLLHTAARITTTARRIHLRISQNWPWATQLAQAFTRLETLPRPAT